MSDNIFIVTPPDDIHIDGMRMLLVDLEPEHTQLISDALAEINSPTSIIVYMAKSYQDHEWFFDKKHKADLIIFNANSDDGFIVGYLGAQPNSYYVGNLNFLSKINNCAIYDTDQVVDLLEKTLKRYVKTRK